MVSMREIWFLALLWCVPLTAAAQDEDRALLQNACSKCHPLEAITVHRNDRERWAQIVDNMVARGAELTDAEIERLIEYLAKNLGPKVNVNKANAKDIAAELDLPEAAAVAIVQYRQKNGSFKNLDDLKKARAVDAKEIERRKDRIEF
jgi:competence protein ComEA